MATIENKVTELLQGFSKLNSEQRFARLQELGVLTTEDVAYLLNGGVRDLELADKLIENSIGYFQLPLGVATNFCIDGKDYVIPLAVEETSIIAALSKTAKWVRQQGKIETKVEGTCIIGQIQLANVNDVAFFTQIFAQHRESLIDSANKNVASSMVKRGGGVIDLILRHRVRDDGGNMMIVHLLFNSCDAMGANLINQVLEYLKDPIERLTNEKVTMCVLSNLNDQKLTTAIVTLEQVGDELGYNLQEASIFAETDAYRAATHNKGVMNGIDPILIATGNDWRAVEAGMHAYACRNGSYQAITRWRYNDGVLTGELTAPIIVGTVGGVTSLHPTAKFCLNMMKINSANELSRVIAAVGLIQNLGAITALCTNGIVQGHMKLHINNLVLAVGATYEESQLLKKELQNWLSTNKRVSLSNAQELLIKIRAPKEH